MVSVLGPSGRAVARRKPSTTATGHIRMYCYRICRDRRDNSTLFSPIAHYIIAMADAPEVVTPSHKQVSEKQVDEDEAQMGRQVVVARDAANAPEAVTVLIDQAAKHLHRTRTPRHHPSPRVRSLRHYQSRQTVNILNLN